MAADNKEKIEIKTYLGEIENITLENVTKQKISEALHNKAIAAHSELETLTVVNTDIQDCLLDPLNPKPQLKELHAIKLVNTTFKATDLIQMIQGAPKLESQNISVDKNCHIIHSHQTELDALTNLIQSKRKSSLSSSLSDVIPFNISTGSKNPKPTGNSLKDRLQGMPVMDGVERRMQKVLGQYNMLPQIITAKTHAHLEKSTLKDAHVLKQGTEPLLTGKPEGTQVHKAFLESPISVDEKATLILTSLGLPPVPGSTDDLPKELIFTPPNEKDPIQNAVRAQYAAIKTEFEATQSAGLGDDAEVPFTVSKRN